MKLQHLVENDEDDDILEKTVRKVRKADNVIRKQQIVQLKKVAAKLNEREIGVKATVVKTGTGIGIQFTRQVRFTAELDEADGEIGFEFPGQFANMGENLDDTDEIVDHLGDLVQELMHEGSEEDLDIDKVTYKPL